MTAVPVFSVLPVWKLVFAYLLDKVNLVAVVTAATV